MRINMSEVIKVIECGVGRGRYENLPYEVCRADIPIRRIFE